MSGNVMADAFVVTIEYGLMTLWKLKSTVDYGFVGSIIDDIILNE